MRLAVQGLMAQPATLDDVAADWRAETAQRAETGGFELAWQAQGELTGIVLQPRLRMHATRMLREAVTNALRHSGGKRLEVLLRADSNQLALQVGDDGAGAPAEGGDRAGQGIAGLHRRAHSLGGRCEVVAGPRGGTRVSIELPLHALPDNAAI